MGDIHKWQCIILKILNVYAFCWGANLMRAETSPLMLDEEKSKLI